jgi:hypothetical protein
VKVTCLHIYKIYRTLTDIHLSVPCHSLNTLTEHQSIEARSSINLLIFTDKHDKMLWFHANFMQIRWLGGKLPLLGEMHFSSHVIPHSEAPAIFFLNTLLLP